MTSGHIGSFIRPPNDRRSPAAASGSRGRRVQPLVGPRGVPLRSKGELCERRFLRQVSGSCADARRNPIGEGDFFGDVPSRIRVDLAHLREVMRWKLAGRSDKSRPHPTMDEGNLAFDEATYENVAAVPDRSRHRENLATLRMRPPAAPNWLSSYGLRERRDRPLRGLEDDAVLTNKSKSLP